MIRAGAGDNTNQPSSKGCAVPVVNTHPAPALLRTVFYTLDDVGVTWLPRATKK